MTCPVMHDLNRYLAEEAKEEARNGHVEPLAGTRWPDWERRIGGKS